MCPACLASAALIAAGAGGGAGFTTLVLRKLIGNCRRARSAIAASPARRA
jgi:hypothetical protein